MKLGRFFIVLLIILTVISLKFPNAFQPLGTGVKAISLELPFKAMEAGEKVASIDEFYSVILEAVREVKDSTKVKIVKYDEKTYDLDTALKKVLDENVELGFVTGCSASFIQVEGKDSAVLELKLEYPYLRDKVIAMRAEAEYKADQIIKSIIKPEMSDYDKVLAVHDYIVLNSGYDRVNADSDTVPPEEHEAYGVLINGIGVCDSYSKAMKLLLEKAGVQCILVEGSKVSNAGQGPVDVDHAWNIVKLDGEYYHVDTTWDDVSEEHDSIELIYDHFNLNDAEMQKTHIWDRSKYPPCSGKKYNYFVYNKLVANNHNEALMMMARAILSRDEKLLVKIADYKSSTYNIGNLIKKAAERCRLKQSISAKWVVNDSLGIVDIKFTY